MVTKTLTAQEHLEAAVASIAIGEDVPTVIMQPVAKKFGRGEGARIENFDALLTNPADDDLQRLVALLGYVNPGVLIHLVEDKIKIMARGEYVAHRENGENSKNAKDAATAMGEWRMPDRIGGQETASVKTVKAIAATGSEDDLDRLQAAIDKRREEMLAASENPEA